jgi:hypothetical protein
MLGVTAGAHGFRSFWHRCATNADFAVDPAQGSAPCLPCSPRPRRTPPVTGDSHLFIEHAHEASGAKEIRTPDLLQAMRL